jgi:hypothetical protein
MRRPKALGLRERFRDGAPAEIRESGAEQLDRFGVDRATLFPRP